MTTTEDRLATALASLAEAAPHDEALSASVRARAEVRPRGRSRLLVPLAAAAAVAAVVATGAVLTGGDGSDDAASPGAGTAATGCAPLTTGVLPEWARGGFSPPYEASYATSASGNLLAILFIPLRQQPLEGTGNKVLWVPRVYPTLGPVSVEGRLDGTDRTTRFVLPTGLGPSSVDVPAAGCWHLELTWDGGSDRVDLSFRG